MNHAFYDHATEWKTNNIGSKAALSHVMSERQLETLDKALRHAKNLNIPVEDISQKQFPLDVEKQRLHDGLMKCRKAKGSSFCAVLTPVGIPKRSAPSSTGVYLPTSVKHSRKARLETSLGMSRMRVWLHAHEPRHILPVIDAKAPRNGFEKQEGKGFYYKVDTTYLEVPPPV